MQVDPSVGGGTIYLRKDCRIPPYTYIIYVYMCVSYMLDKVNQLYSFNVNMLQSPAIDQGAAWRSPCTSRYFGVV